MLKRRVLGTVLTLFAVSLACVGAWWLMGSWRAKPIEPAQSGTQEWDPYYAHANDELIGPPAYERVRLGMSHAEVEQAIGLPAGEYDTKYQPHGMLSSGPFGQLLREAGLPEERLSDTLRTNPGKVTVTRWIGNYYWIWVVFDESGGAIGRYLYAVL